MAALELVTSALSTKPNLGLGTVGTTGGCVTPWGERGGGIGVGPGRGRPRRVAAAVARRNAEGGGAQAALGRRADRRRRPPPPTPTLGGTGAAAARTDMARREGAVRPRAERGRKAAIVGERARVGDQCRHIFRHSMRHLFLLAFACLIAATAAQPAPSASSGGERAPRAAGATLADTHPLLSPSVLGGYKPVPDAANDADVAAAAAFAVEQV